MPANDDPDNLNSAVLLSVHQPIQDWTTPTIESVTSQTKHCSFRETGYYKTLSTRVERDSSPFRGSILKPQLMVSSFHCNILRQCHFIVYALFFIVLVTRWADGSSEIVDPDFHDSNDRESLSDDHYEYLYPGLEPTLKCTDELLKAPPEEKKQCFLKVPESKKYVQLYGKVTLHCQVGNLQGNMQWSRPGVAVLGFGSKPLVHPKKYDYEEGVGAKHLVIRNVTMDLEGKYECQVQPTPNLLRYKTEIIILVKPTKPVLRVNGQEARDNELVHIRNEVERQKFVCMTIGGNPSPRFVWYKGGHMVRERKSKPPPVKDILNYRYEDVYEIRTSKLKGGETITCSVNNEAIKRTTGGTTQSMSSNVITVKQRPPGNPDIKVITDQTNYFEGDRYEALCSARRGVPSGNLVWKQYMSDGKEGRHKFYRYELDGQKLVNRLRIEALTRADHNSRLVCAASNEMTQRSLSAEIKVEVQFPPQSAVIQSYPPSHKKIVLPNGREITVVYGREGQTKLLTCLSDYYFKSVTVEWFKDGIVIPKKVHVIKTSAGYRCQSNVTITFSKGDDGKDVICKFSGVRSQYTVAQVRLNIMYPPGRPYIEGYRSNEPVRYGTKIRMRCVSRGGNPPPNLHWYRDNGKQKITGGRDRSDGDKRIKDLTFIPQREDNGDRYVCKSTNAVAGSSEMLSSADVQLNVQFPPDRISINSLGKGAVSEGQQLSFVCKAAAANPQVTVKWRKLRCKRENECTSTNLAVSKVRNNAGNFGGIETSSFVNFMVKWQDHRQFVECQAISKAFPDMVVRDQMQLNVTFSPKFPPDVSRPRVFPEGSKLEIDLNPLANPPISRHTWLQNVHPVFGYDDIRFSQTKLVIKQVLRTHMANYTLVVHNGLGETRVSFFLNVTYPPRVINNVRTNITERRGKSVELRCRFEANPAPLSGIIWRRVHPVTRVVLAEVFCRGSRSNNINIRRKMRAKCKSIPKRLRASTTLTLFDLDRTDTGVYQCILENGVGRPSLRQFEVLVPSTAVIVLNPRLSKSAADIGGSVNIKCEADGEPWVTFTWFRGQDNLTLAMGKKYKMSTVRLYTGRYRGTLHVSNVKNTDYGDYYCQATNGMAPDVVRLTLIKPRAPDAPINLRVVNVTATTVTLAWTQGFDGGYRQKFQIRWREIAPRGSLYSSDGHYQHVDAGSSSTNDDMQHTVRGLSPNKEYAFTMTARNLRRGVGPRTMPVRARTKPQFGQSFVTPNNQRKNQRGRSDDTSILIIATACVIGGLIFIINVFVITCILRRKGRCRGSHKQEYMKADTVELYQHHQPPSITGSSQQGADSVTVSEALLHNYREMHPLAGAGMQPEFYEPGLYPGLPPRLVSSVPNSSPIPNSLPPPSPAQSAVLPSHTYVNVDNIMHSSFPRDPNMYHYIRHAAMPRDSYMEDAKRVHFSDSLRQRMTTSGIYASPQRSAPPEPPERTVSNQLSVSQLVIPPPQDFSPPESACESVIERPIVTASSPLRTNQNGNPMTNSITTFAAISTDPDDEGYTSVV